MRLALTAIGIFSVGVLAHQVIAAPTVFFARDGALGSPTNSGAKVNQFTTALNSFGVDDIDTAIGMNPALTFGSTGITATGGGALAQAAPGFVIGLQGLLELDAVGFPQVNTTFTFNQHITAFGLYVIQGGDGANSNPTTFRLRDTVSNTFVDVPIQVGPDWGFTNVFFFGVAETVPFNQVEIIETGDLADGMLYDNVVAGIVPEPCSLMLLAVAGVGVAARTRGRRSVA